MSSSVEQGPSAGLLAKVKEALKNPHLVWVGENAPTPRQAAIVCQALNLTNEEEKQAKAVAVLKRDWPEQFKTYVSVVSETDTDTETRSRKKGNGISMGCRDNWGRKSVAEIERENLVRQRGYFEGLLGQPSTCLRCGAKVDFMKWEIHDTFHARVDEDFERKNKHGIFSDHHQQSQ